MRRLLACLAPWMAVAAAWAQAQTGLSIDYTYRGSFSDQGTRVGSACFVTPQLMRKIGWSVDVTDGVATVLAEGRAFQLESKIIDGARLYPFDDALRYIGASSNWVEENGHLRVLAQVRSIDLKDGKLRIDATMAVRPRAYKSGEPPKFFVDIEGAELESHALENLPKDWKAVQLSPTSVRCTLEGPIVAVAKVPQLAEGRTIECQVTAVSTSPVQALVNLGTPVATSESDSALMIRIPVTGKPAQSATAVFIDPNTVQISLPGSTTDKTGDFPLPLSKHAKAMSVLDDKQGTASVTVRLDHPMAFQVSTYEGSIMVSFQRPRAQGGLTGKVIVVDAGHGGKDNGATHGGVMEKEMTLLMAKTVAKALTEAGASIIMTRGDDTFIPLSERPGMANRSKASLFLSCHFNSNTVSESRSGIIVFFHKQDSMDMLLAECIRHEIAKTSGLPDLGVWSDGRIYDSGFAVLRGAEMPAVLMELGFLNHSRDRARIQQQGFRDAVAQAVVQGVKVFFGDEKKD